MAVGLGQPKGNCLFVIPYVLALTALAIFGIPLSEPNLWESEGSTHTAFDDGRNVPGTHTSTGA
jgi:hypothetical protein